MGSTGRVKSSYSSWDPHLLKFGSVCKSFGIQMTTFSLNLDILAFEIVLWHWGPSYWGPSPLKRDCGPGDIKVPVIWKWLGGEVNVCIKETMGGGEGHVCMRGTSGVLSLAMKLSIRMILDQRSKQIIVYYNLKYVFPLMNIKIVYTLKLPTPPNLIKLCFNL